MQLSFDFTLITVTNTSINRHCLYTRKKCHKLKFEKSNPESFRTRRIKKNTCCNRDLHRTRVDHHHHRHIVYRTRRLWLFPRVERESRLAVDWMLAHYSALARSRSPSVHRECSCRASRGASEQKRDDPLHETSRVSPPWETPPRLMQSVRGPARGALGRISIFLGAREYYTCYIHFLA